MNLAHLKATGKTPRSESKARLREHRLFAPVWGLWGAALGGLSVLVMPRALIWQQLGDLAAEFSVMAVRLGMATCAALLIGAVCFAIAYALHHKAIGKGKRASVAEMAGRRLRPIDPATELGSEHFDAPVETAPFGLGSLPADATGESDTANWLPQDEDAASIAPAQPDSDLVDVPVDDSQPGRQLTLDDLALDDYELPLADDPLASEREDKSQTCLFTRRHYQAALQKTCETSGLTIPRELDLAEFAQLPGRNAVWVEVPAGNQTQPETPAVMQETAHAPAHHPASPPVPAAVARLREVPPAELSLVQMVERFAAALHEHQAKSQDRALQAQSGNTAARLQRDVALAEALRALSLFTENGLAEMGGNGAGNEAQDNLRDAMMKLQSLRGVA